MPILVGPPKKKTFTRVGEKKEREKNQYHTKGVIKLKVLSQ